MVFIVKDFNCTCICENRQTEAYITGCSSFSCEFVSGNVYVLQGEIDCGAFAFCQAIASTCKERSIFPTPEIYIDEKKMSVKEMEKYVCYISHNRLKGIDLLTFRQYMGLLKKKHCYMKPLDDLFKQFHIPDQIQKRRIKYINDYMPSLLAMRGIIQGKRIFTTGWMGSLSRDVRIIDIVSNKFIMENCIVIIPASKDVLFNKEIRYINFLDCASRFC